MQKDKQCLMDTGLDGRYRIEADALVGAVQALVVPATAGFGVDYQGLHGTDERIRLESIPVVQAAYHHALLTLLHDDRS